MRICKMPRGRTSNETVKLKMFLEEGIYRKNVYLELVFVLLRLESNNVVQQPRISL
jgi:hypothetical protein